MFGFSTTPYRYRRPIGGALTQWELIALAVAWGLMTVAVFLNIVVHP